VPPPPKLQQIQVDQLQSYLQVPAKLNIDQMPSAHFASPTIQLNFSSEIITKGSVVLLKGSQMPKKLPKCNLLLLSNAKKPSEMQPKSKCKNNSEMQTYDMNARLFADFVSTYR
jgi:hypothetical protein